jgi:HSP20 family molecular chaperone IbpA
MTLIGYAAERCEREMGKWSQEFYAFVMPAVDMYEEGSDLVVKIDLPGFKKEDVKIRIIDGNILAISAKRKLEEHAGAVYYIRRPIQIDKRMVLPISTKEGEKVAGTASYLDGVVTLRVPIPRTSVVPIT